MRFADDLSEELQREGVLDMIHFHVVSAPPADRFAVAFDIAAGRVAFEVVCGTDDDGGKRVTISLATERP